MKYNQGVDKETPNDIYKKVFEDNKKFTFENDVYSSEFFDFIKDILTSVASFAGNDEVTADMRNNTMKVARKVCFDILARCFYNQGIKEIVDIMIKIFEKDDNLSKNFVTALLDSEFGEPIFEILLDCPDIVARVNIAHLFKYLLTQLKMSEKDDLINDTKIEVSEEVKNAETGEETTITVS